MSAIWLKRLSQVRCLRRQWNGWTEGSLRTWNPHISIGSLYGGVTVTVTVTVIVSLATTPAKSVFSKWLFDDMTADSERGLQAGRSSNRLSNRSSSADGVVSTKSRVLGHSNRRG